MCRNRSLTRAYSTIFSTSCELPGITFRFGWMKNSGFLMPPCPYFVIAEIEWIQGLYTKIIERQPKPVNCRKWTMEPPRGNLTEVRLLWANLSVIFVVNWRCSRSYRRLGSARRKSSHNGTPGLHFSHFGRHRAHPAHGVLAGSELLRSPRIPIQHDSSSKWLDWLRCRSASATQRANAHPPP